MLYKKILFLIIFLFISNCTTGTLVKNKQNKIITNSFTNRGFALVYS